jgi:hypothetical protein
MPSIRINRTALPDPSTDKLTIESNDGQTIGVLEFASKSGTTTSTLVYASGQEQHRHYPLRSKHRPR